MYVTPYRPPMATNRERVECVHLAHHPAAEMKSAVTIFEPNAFAECDEPSQLIRFGEATLVSECGEDHAGQRAELQEVKTCRN